MKVVGHRNGEKEENQGTADRGPSLKGMGVGTPTLVNPASAPSPQEGDGNQRPQNIEEQFHGNLHYHWPK
jgi:hypothetical protein